jgi:hypothetical protein
VNKPLPLLELHRPVPLTAPANTDDDFDWFDKENKSVIVPPTRGLAIYENQFDEIVIRQQTMHADGDDPFLNVPQEHAQAIIDALKPYAVRS